MCKETKYLTENQEKINVHNRMDQKETEWEDSENLKSDQERRKKQAH